MDSREQGAFQSLVLGYEQHLNVYYISLAYTQAGSNII